MEEIADVKALRQERGVFFFVFAGRKKSGWLQGEWARRKMDR